MPPPVQIGERDVPARARPVPFWRHGFAPPPRTIPRVRVACVPWRRAASSAITTSCTSGPLNGTPNTASSSLIFLVPPRTGAVVVIVGPFRRLAFAGAGWQGRRHEGVPLAHRGPRTPPGGDRRAPDGEGARGGGH